MATKEDILGSDDLAVISIPTPEWKKSPTTYLRTMSGVERDAYEDASYEWKGEGKKKTLTFIDHNYRARLLVRCIANQDGTRIFADTDAEALGKKAGKVLTRLYAEAVKLNGLGADSKND